MENVTLGQGGILAILGYAMVFFGLILLMILTIVLGKFFAAKTKKNAAPAAPAAVEETAASEAPVAPGSAGQLKLYNVDPKIAAMIMAIVADTMGKPINELRFLSIKEVAE